MRRLAALTLLVAALTAVVVSGVGAIGGTDWGAAHGRPSVQAGGGDHWPVLRTHRR